MGKSDKPKTPGSTTRQKSSTTTANNDDLPTTSNTVTSDQFASLQATIEKLVHDNLNLTTKVEKSLETIDSNNKKYEENNKLMTEMITKLDILTGQNENLLQKNALLEKQLEEEKLERINMEERLLKIINPIQIKQRENNLELHGLTEKEDEDCSREVANVLSKVVSEPVSIINTQRIGNKIGHDGKKRNRPILIHFQHKEQRDKLYTNRVNLKKLEGERLYLNENLPPNLSVLKGKANTIRKSKNYKFLWTKNGNILLRKNEGSEVINIKMLSDLEKII